MKLILIFYILFFSLGCQFSPQPEKKVQTTQKTQKKVQIVQKKVISEMLRGIIKSQYFDKNSDVWQYKLQVIDIVSDNLNTFNFKYPQKLYNIGDLVYVILDKKDRNNIKNIYLIKKDYTKQIQNKQKTNKKQKRTKLRKTPWIKAPKTETIKLQ